MSDLHCRLAAIRIHPVKSCAGIGVDEALLVETGLEFDRALMLVDPEHRMVTQRQLPRLALVRPQLRSEEMLLRAPGMLGLHVALDRVEAPTRVRVWDDEVKAFDMGDLAAQWFSDFAGQALRLVRFDPDQRRLSNRRWSGAVEAENAFSDGFPLLVAGQASLADLNRRLAERGQGAAGIERFRPNLVLDGIEPYDEDQIDTLTIEAEGGDVRLKLVKPCVRCTIPSVDPVSGVQGDEPGATLAGYRADPRMNGGITFAMNAVVVEGLLATLRVNQRVGVEFGF